MNVKIGIAAMVLAVCGLFAGNHAYSAGDSGKEYTIVVKRVEVKKTKADGSAWDIMDGAPDLFVRVSNVSVKGSKSFDTEVKDDTYTAEFNTPTNIKFVPGQTVRFEVIDKDIAANDEVGKADVELSEKVIKDGTVRISNFGQVIVLEITVKKL